MSNIEDETVKVKVSKLLVSDLVHVMANLSSFTDKQLGMFIRKILLRELSEKA